MCQGIQAEVSIKMKLSILPRLYACAVFSTLIATFCHCQMTPEDLLTDSDEQLDKLKRDDFVDSILEQFPSLEPLGEPSEEDKENNEKEKDSQHAKNEPGDAAKTAALSSVFPSPSAFTFASIKTSNISTSNSVSTSAAASNKTVLDNSTYVRPTGSVYNLHSSIFVNQTNTKDLAFQTRELLIDKSATHSINDTKSTMNVLQSSSLVSTINSSMSSVVISTSPAVHSPSIVSDTAQSKIQPTSTSFVGDAALVSSTIKETPKIVSPIVSLSSTKVKVSTSPGSSGRKMPVTPDESRFGGNCYISMICL